MPDSDTAIKDGERKTLFLFPGQGSQYRGMGSDLYEDYACVREIYHEATDVLGYDMAELSFLDPDEQIHLTRYTQPALLTHSIACLKAYEEQATRRVIPQVSAGHSLGEYCALLSAGALDFRTALSLVSRRGELMSQYGEGEMEALPLRLEEAMPLAQKHLCSIAACNMPDQTVVGGRPSDLDALVVEFTEQYPKKRSARLKTEGAFHTYYMVEAARHFRSVLDQATIRSPDLQVLSNYTGTFHDPDSRTIKSCLFWQLFHPVLWNDNLTTAVEGGINTIVEFGGGIGQGETPTEKKPNLAGIVRKTFRRATCPPVYHAVINSETLAETVEALSS
ncbi:MAG: ACP S-malonyltransferase [Arenicellales bacterium]|jgi:[acyl-carrier-protein] S-malonyltransferase|nr:ACP S-malonyltransferase [Arenicellales bacterium]|tara:strand:- start:100 stop:1104 length:1005 start_codon:yes stop_codon:yes gene_type:complete